MNKFRRDNFKIVAIPGSLRQASMNKGLLRAAREVAPEGVDIEIYDLDDIPFYNQDVDLHGAPESVQKLRDAIRKADAVLIATPEYNYSIPGVLKNALDWASRPVTDSALRYKPVGIIGATGGISGTIRAQLALRQVLQGTESYVMPKPEVLLASAAHLFNAEGDLCDEPTRDRLRGFIDALVAWTERLQRGAEPVYAQSDALLGAAAR